MDGSTEKVKIFSKGGQDMGLTGKISNRWFSTITGSVVSTY